MHHAVASGLPAALADMLRLMLMDLEQQVAADGAAGNVDRQANSPGRSHVQRDSADASDSTDRSRAPLLQTVVMLQAFASATRRCQDALCPVDAEGAALQDWESCVAPSCVFVQPRAVDAADLLPACQLAVHCAPVLCHALCNVAAAAPMQGAPMHAPCRGDGPTVCQHALRGLLHLAAVDSVAVATQQAVQAALCTHAAASFTTCAEVCLALSQVVLQCNGQTSSDICACH
jgi:hypothetical protein